MSLVDSRSPELALSTKNNIVHPGVASRRTEDVKLAALREADDAGITQNTYSVVGAVVTKTKNIK